MRLNAVLLSIGVLLASIPGLFIESLRMVSTACLIMGALAIGTATVRNGISRPQSALLLLATQMQLFWLSYGPWHLRLKAAGPSPRQGIETFAGGLAEWVILLVAFSVYETGMLFGGDHLGP